MIRHLVICRLYLLNNCTINIGYLAANVAVNRCGIKQLQSVNILIVCEERLEFQKRAILFYDTRLRLSDPHFRVATKRGYSIQHGGAHERTSTVSVSTFILI